MPQINGAFSYELLADELIAIVKKSTGLQLIESSTADLNQTNHFFPMKSSRRTFQ